MSRYPKALQPLVTQLIDAGFVSKRGRLLQWPLTDEATGILGLNIATRRLRG